MILSRDETDTIRRILQESKTIAVVGLSLAEMGVHKCSRIDPQTPSTACPSAGEVIKQFRAGKLAVATAPSLTSWTTPGSVKPGPMFGSFAQGEVPASRK